MELTVAFVKYYDVRTSIVANELGEMVGNFFGSVVLQWNELWIFTEVVYHCHHILVAIWTQCMSTLEVNGYLVPCLVGDMDRMYCGVGLLCVDIFCPLAFVTCVHIICYILSDLGPEVPLGDLFPCVILSQIISHRLCLYGVSYTRIDVPHSLLLHYSVSDDSYVILYK